jgi:hypothetical protein
MWIHCVWSILKSEGVSYSFGEKQADGVQLRPKSKADRFLLWASDEYRGITATSMRAHMMSFIHSNRPQPKTLKSISVAVIWIRFPLFRACSYFKHINTSSANVCSSVLCTKYTMRRRVDLPGYFLPFACCIFQNWSTDFGKTGIGYLHLSF